MRITSSLTRHKRDKQHKKNVAGFIGRKIKKSMDTRYKRSLQFAYIGRKQQKRNIRSLWIQRINAALVDVSYSKFIKKMIDSNIILNRKILSSLAYFDSESFNQIVSEVLKEKTDSI